MDEEKWAQAWLGCWCGFVGTCSTQSPWSWGEGNADYNSEQGLEASFLVKQIGEMNLVISARSTVDVLFCIFLFTYILPVPRATLCPYCLAFYSLLLFTLFFIFVLLQLLHFFHLLFFTPHSFSCPLKLFVFVFTCRYLSRSTCNQKLLSFELMHNIFSRNLLQENSLNNFLLEEPFGWEKPGPFRKTGIHCYRLASWLDTLQVAPMAGRGIPLKKKLYRETESIRRRPFRDSAFAGCMCIYSDIYIGTL